MRNLDDDIITSCYIIFATLHCALVISKI